MTWKNVTSIQTCKNRYYEKQFETIFFLKQEHKIWVPSRLLISVDKIKKSVNLELFHYTASVELPTGPITWNYEGDAKKGEWWDKESRMMW